MPQSPLLAANDTILWLKAVLSAAAIVLLYLRLRRADSVDPHSFQPRATFVVAVVLAFATFHNFGEFRSGRFIHIGEMFHYYLGSKYFREVGSFDLYNAVIVADTEQGNELASAPFHTDLRTYQNAPREKALADSDRIRGLFSEERWNAFKADVAFFKRATGSPHSPGLFFLLMDHGYNGSPVSSFILGTIANMVPVTQLHLLAFLDVLLVVVMSALVFRTFGFDMGALFSIYFCINYLNAYDFISGSFLRYDWLFCIVAAVCLLAKQRYASSAFFLTLSAMIKVFPAVLFYGLAVVILKSVRATRRIDKKHLRFMLTAGATAAMLFWLPSISLGSALQPWKEFSEKIALHDNGVYVNHLGFRGIALFEPSHLSLEKFIAAYKSSHTNDIVRHWQDVKEAELERKKPIILLASLLVVACLTVIIWRSKSEVESLLWPLVLIYVVSYPSHYYYAFLCLFILLFFRRPNSPGAFVPLCLLLVLNIGALVTDAFRPSPIVFYSLVNIYLFVFFASILGFELYTSARGTRSSAAAASLSPPREVRRSASQRKRRRHAQARGR